MILDEIADAEKLEVSEQELINFLVQSAQQYGMDPNEFIKIVSEQGQVPAYVGETMRRKALGFVLEHAEVADAKGKKVDLGEFLKTDVEAEDDHAGHNH